MAQSPDSTLTESLKAEERSIITRLIYPQLNEPVFTMQKGSRPLTSMETLDFRPGKIVELEPRTQVVEYIAALQKQALDDLQRMQDYQLTKNGFSGGSNDRAVPYKRVIRDDYIYWQPTYNHEPLVTNDIRGLQLADIQRALSGQLAASIPVTPPKEPNMTEDEQSHKVWMEESRRAEQHWRKHRESPAQTAGTAKDYAAAIAEHKRVESQLRKLFERANLLAAYYQAKLHATRTAITARTAFKVAKDTAATLAKLEKQVAKHASR